MPIDKLSVFLRVLGFEPEPPQLALLRWMTSDTRTGVRAVRKLLPRKPKNTRLLLWGRGSGKSTLSVLTSLFTALSCPGSQTVYASPSVEQTENVLMKYARQFCDRIKGELVRYNVADFLKRTTNRRVLAFKNGSEVLFTPNRAGAIRGLGPQLLICDECSAWPHDSNEGTDLPTFLSAIRPRMVSEHKSGYKIFLSGTPEAACGPVYDMFTQPKAHNVSVVRLPTWRVRPSIKRSYFKDLPEGERRREIECEFADDEDSIIPLSLIESAESHAIPEPETAPVLAIDQATRHDKTGFAVVSRKHGDGNNLDAFFVHELRRQRVRRDLSDFTTVVKGLQQKWKPRKVILDQFGADALMALLRTHGIEATSRAWTRQNRDSAFVNFREMLQNGQIFLPESKALRREVAGLRITYLRSGHRRVEHSPEGDDQLFALMLGLEDLRCVAEPRVTVCGGSSEWNTVFTEAVTQ